ncbi:MAG: autotransporter assembly complex family protein [Pseudomonadota bacterium]
MTRHLIVLVTVIMALALPRAALALDYTVAVGALEDSVTLDDDITQLIRDAVLLEQLREEGAPSRFVLQRRAKDDVPRVQDVLRSRGYYAGRVEISVSDDPEPVAMIQVQLGPQYTIGNITIEGADGEPFDLVNQADLEIEPGQPALARDVIAAEPRGIASLRSQGYALARAGDRRVTVNHQTQQLSVQYRYIPGPVVVLGDVSLSGLRDVAPITVMRRVRFDQGDTFDPAILSGLRGSLSELGVFESVTVQLTGLRDIDRSQEQVQVPVEIEVVERKSRTIGGGISLSTDEGFGTEARWRHRNILGQAEKLSIIARVGRVGAPDAQGIDYGLEAQFEKPDFLTIDQTLLLGASAIVEAPEAFERQAIEFTAALERPLTDDIDARTGIRLAFEDVQDSDDPESEQFVTIAFPNTLTLDKTDDLLDPTEGYAVDLLAEPVLTANDAGASYAIFRVNGRYFWSPWENNRAVFAMRAGLGSIVGADVDSIPANRRFYAGGDGSVRGYAFQAVGPEDADNDPSGGRSLFETGIETRIRVTDTIGIVPFVDAGIVTEESFVDFSEDLRVGAGLGVRYFTNFGPLRMDLGVPLNADDDDDAFQIYFSLGQAF